MREWKASFLDALEKTGNVSAAAAAAGISRPHVYLARADDPEFAVAWSERIEAAVQSLEGEARRRALDGVEEPIYHQGEQCGTVRRYSDTLMIFLLKAHRPERYRERSQTEHTGGVTVRVIYDDLDSGGDGDPDPAPPSAPGPAADPG